MNKLTSSEDNLKRYLKIVLLGLSSFYVLVFLIQIFVQIDLFPVNKFTLGIDFRDFYNASTNFNNGVSIYSDDLIVSPPTFLLFLQPLNSLPFDSAVKAFFILNLTTAFICAFLSIKVFNKQIGENFALLTVVFFLSFPFLFLLERGNIDLLVLLFLVIGLLLYQKDYKYLSGSAFAFSIGLKLYPALLLIPLIINREKKCLIGVITTAIILFVSFPTLNIEFIESRIIPMISSTEFSRFTHFRMDENGSLANLFYGINHYFKSVFALEHLISERIIFKLSTWLYVLMLFALIYSNVRTKINTPENITLYIPFMIAIPKLVYLYEYVMLLPLIIVLLRKDFSFESRIKELFFCIPFVLVFSNIVVLEKLWQTDRYHFLPPLGLFFLMIYSIKYFRRSRLLAIK